MSWLFQAKHTKEELGFDGRKRGLQFENRRIIKQGKTVWDEGTIVDGVSLNHEQAAPLGPGLGNKLFQIRA